MKLLLGDALFLPISFSCSSSLRGGGGRLEEKRDEGGGSANFNLEREHDEGSDHIRSLGGADRDEIWKENLSTTDSFKNE